MDPVQCAKHERSSQGPAMLGELPAGFSYSNRMAAYSIGRTLTSIADQGPP